MSETKRFTKVPSARLISPLRFTFQISAPLPLLSLFPPLYRTIHSARRSEWIATSLGCRYIPLGVRQTAHSLGCPTPIERLAMKVSYHLFVTVDQPILTHPPK